MEALESERKVLAMFRKLGNPVDINRVTFDFHIPFSDREGYDEEVRSYFQKRTVSIGIWDPDGKGPKLMYMTKPGVFDRTTVETEYGEYRIRVKQTLHWARKEFDVISNEELIGMELRIMTGDEYPEAMIGNLVLYGATGQAFLVSGMVKSKDFPGFRGTIQNFT